MAKICLVCISLRAGGTERIVSNLANSFVKKHEVDIVLLSDKEPFYALNSGISLHQFQTRPRGAGRIRYYNGLARFIRLLIRERRPDVIFSFGELIGPFVRLATIGLGSSLYVFNRGAPDRSLKGVSGWLNPIAYPFAKAVVVQTDAAVHALKKRYRLCKFAVIPNPVQLPQKVTDVLDRSKIVVNVGSIGRLKNQVFLLNAFARSPLSDEWELHFVGDGPDRERLQVLASNLGVAKRVSFLGERKDVSDILANAQVFAFTSLSEGFPNALAEALAHGCACISFDCPTGPAELIRHNKNGILVPMGAERQYETDFDRILSDDGLRARLGQSAKRSIGRFAPDKVLDRYQELIAESVRQA